MTTDSSAPSVQVSTAALVAAARALIRGARFAEAADLLASVTSDQAEVALLRAEVAVALDWYRGQQVGDEALQAAAAFVAQDAVARWDLDALTVRHGYGQQLFSSEKDAGTVAALSRRAAELSDQAPDDGRRGWAEMYRGWIADNLREDRIAAPPHYRNALRSAEQTGDDYLRYEALRHLGDHSHDAGDIAAARAQWERSTESGARAGAVIGTLAQQLLLAQLARETGDEAGALLLAREISRWTGALGLDRHRAMADAFRTGQDPTKAPAPDEPTTE